MENNATELQICNVMLGRLPSDILLGTIFETCLRKFVDRSVCYRVTTLI